MHKGLRGVQKSEIIRPCVGELSDRLSDGPENFIRLIVCPLIYRRKIYNKDYNKGIEERRGMEIAPFVQYNQKVVENNLNIWLINRLKWGNSIFICGII